jgi:hypothetical protein
MTQWIVNNPETGSLFDPIRIDPRKCQKGKSRGVTFKTGAHERKRKNSKRDRKDFSKSKREFF